MNNIFSNPWQKPKSATVPKRIAKTNSENASPTKSAVGTRNGVSTRRAKRRVEVAARIAEDKLTSPANVSEVQIDAAIEVAVPETVSQLAERYLVAPTTRSWRHKLVRRICKSLGSFRIDGVTSEHLDAFQEMLLASDRDVKYVQRVMSTARELFKFACNKEWLDPTHNPVNGITAPKRTETAQIRARREAKEQLPLMSMHDIALLVSHAKGWLLTAILLALFAGLRGQEMRALQRRHVEILVDMVRCRIVQAIKLVRFSPTDEPIEIVGGTKSTAGRRPIEVQGLLHKHLKTVVAELESLDDFFLPPDPGKQFMRYETLWQALHDLQVSLGIGRRLPDGSYIGTYGVHALRHTCVALLIWSGMSERRIAHMLGHQVDDLDLTLKRYGYLFAAQLENPDEWPAGPVPTSAKKPKSIIAEMEDD